MKSQIDLEQPRREGTLWSGGLTHLLRNGRMSLDEAQQVVAAWEALPQDSLLREHEVDVILSLCRGGRAWDRMIGKVDTGPAWRSLMDHVVDLAFGLI